MLELSLNQVMKHMGVNLILKDVNFSLYEGDKVGIIGANGSGKSTILKMIAGIEPLKLFPGAWSKGYDFGWISLPKTARVAYLNQIPHYEEHVSVKEILQMAFHEALLLEMEMRQLEKLMTTSRGEDLVKIMKKYGQVMEAFEIKGGYEMHEKVNKVITGLNFTEEFLEKPFSKLSGGERTTVELGKLLIHQPEILLLDEPTNHLDVEAIEWLEGYLKTYKGIVVMVSHDRYFLDAITNKTIEIEFQTTHLYNGNYSSFKMQKDELLRIQADQYKEQQKDIKAMKKKVQELRQWAMQSDNNKFFQRAASIQIKMEKIKKINRPVFERQNMRLSFEDQSRSGEETIIGRNFSKAYEEQILFHHCNLMIHYGERVALVGDNGSGKSTLIKMIMSEIEPDEGEVYLGANTKVAYLPQYITFSNEEMTVIECFREHLLIEEGKAREYLAKFMFFNKRVFTPVKGLSGGERIRLKLAQLLYDEVNVLILDEPTNHLDLDSIETLEAALRQFSGTICFVSHDRYLIEVLSDRVIAIENQGLISYEAYSDYRNAKQMTSVDEIKKEEKKVSLKEKPTKNSETEILLLENKMAELESQMLAYGSDYEKLSLLQEEKLALEKQWESLYDAWEKNH
ncbi:MAG: ABC-F family ATP-binding cassette domain-containing protein [Clostridia bacterium]|nr:ABC-F family ATP-binding cassette domain-containing protein [Clostridia bacterium]